MFVEQIQQDNADSEQILWILADPYCREILKNIREKPESCMEICAETKIPISTVYRRMQSLQDQNLVQISGTISENGKKYFLYKSKVEAIHASYADKLELQVIRK